MLYREVLPDPILTQHVECFWELTILPEEANCHYEVMAPDCTFDIIFSAYPLELNFTNRTSTAKMNAGGAFVGQKTCGVQFAVHRPQRITGIRFKPFAFAHLFSIPPNQINDKTLPIKELFVLSREDWGIIHQIIEEKDFEQKVSLCEKLTLRILKDDLQIDQLFRAQLNYILERKGSIAVRDLFSTFGISKVTLRKHFLQKMGLSPKVVSRIWRLNHFLELQKQSNANLTCLALESGYYDQAHFIREFKSFFQYSPRQFFKQESQLLRISQEIISKRFSNRYDPIFIA